MLKGLLKDSVIYGLSGIIASFISIFLIPLYTKVFDPADYGIISILTTTSVFLNILIIFALDNSAAVWFWDKPDQNERKVTFNSWLVFVIFSGCLLSLVFVFLSKPLSQLFFQTDNYQLLFILVGLNLLFVGFQKVVNIWCRMLHKPVKAMLYSLLMLATTVALNILLVLYWKIGIQGVFYSQLASGLVGFVAMFILLGKWVHLKLFSFKRLKDMLRFSLPLVPAALLYWIMNMASIYFIKLLVKDNAEIGLYQVGSSVANILSLCTWAFFQAWTPFALSISKKEDARDTYGNIFELYCILGITCSFLLLFFSKEILLIFTNTKYIGAWKVIGLLAINVIILGVPNILAIAYALVKKNTPYTIAMAIGSVFTISFFFLLIPYLGKEGAAIAMICGNLVTCCITAYTAQKLYFIPYRFKRVLLFALIVGGVFLLLLEFDFGFLQKILISIFLIGGFLIFFFERIKRKYLIMFQA